jgi:hypothetical protein
VASKPNGKTIRIGCTGCPATFTLLSIVPPIVSWKF